MIIHSLSLKAIKKQLNQSPKYLHSLISWTSSALALVNLERYSTPERSSRALRSLWRWFTRSCWISMTFMGRWGRNWSFNIVYLHIPISSSSLHTSTMQTASSQCLSMHQKAICIRNYAGWTTLVNLSQGKSFSKSSQPCGFCSKGMWYIGTLSRKTSW